MQRSCLQEDCTVEETGVCLLNNNLETCAYRVSEEIDSNLSNSEAELDQPQNKVETTSRLPTSFTLTLKKVRETMGDRYCRMVGILGLPNAGKTAALVSLFLLISRGKLNDYSFANSLTLMAFTKISQGARRWNEGQLPEQLTTHTELAEDRTAGFLHLRLKPLNHSEAVDLFFPDLPGEWTTKLIEENRVDRFEFLKRSDVVWLVIDGKSLFCTNSRQLTIHHTKLLMQRLVGLIEPTQKLILVVTRKDLFEPHQQTLDELLTEAQKRGLCMDIVFIASFSGNGKVAPGDGISELISRSMHSVQDTPTFWPDSEYLFTNARTMLRFRK